MKNPVLRWTLIILGGLLVLLLIAAGVLAFLVSRIDTRAEIERAVERATGRDLVITGDVGVSFYPVLGLRATDASLANVRGGRAPALAAIGAVSVGVELRPLLDRQVVVRELVLTEPRIALELDAQGRPNWALTPPPSPPGAPRTEIPSQMEPQRVTLERLQIQRGQVSYFDARRNTGWSISDVNMRTRIESLDDPLVVEGDLIYAGEKVDLEAVFGQPRAAIAGRPTTIAARISSEPLTGTMEGELATATGGFSGNVAMQGPSLRGALAWLVAPIPAGYGLETFTVNGKLSTGPRQVSFENAALTIDAIRGRGDFVLQQQRGKPYVSGRLELLELDVNPYIAAATGVDSEAEIAQAAAAPARTVDVTQAPTDAPLDFSGVKSINADLELTSGPFKFQRLHGERAQISLVLNDGYLAATMHDLRMYGGSGRGRMELDARTEDVRFVQELRATGVDARGLLTDAVGFGNLEGTTEAYINVTTHGSTQAAILRELDGRVSFEMRSGALRGVDLGGVATTIRRALSDDLIAANARTTLNGLSATFAISNGVMASETMSFNTPDLQLRGLGVIDISRRTLDLRVAPQRAVIAIPFRVQGPWDRLLYASDVSGRGRDEIEARVRQVQQEARRSGP